MNSIDDFVRVAGWMRSCVGCFVADWANENLHTSQIDAKPPLENVMEQQSAIGSIVRGFWLRTSRLGAKL